jgi:ABC-type molybdate transport system substrate-binding protein
LTAAGSFRLKTTLLSFLLLIMLIIGCRKNSEPLRIACSADMLPVVTELGREFRKNFGVPVMTTVVGPSDFDFDTIPGFDFIITDDLATIARLRENGKVIRTIDIAYTLPILVLRRGDNLPVLKLADLAIIDRSVRMTIASSGATLPQIVRTRFEKSNISFEGGEAKIQLLPFLVKEILSDGTQRLTTPDVMLQQLRDGETDIVVFWDFVAMSTEMKQDDSNHFVTVAWPPEPSDTITLQLALVKDCTDLPTCEVFMNFVKSRRGYELLQSCFLHPCDDLVGTR